jgi:C4-type Zn-finger protein
METTEEIRKCPSCGQRMRKMGKAARIGYTKQRWQCTNRECAKYGKMQLEGF